MGKGGSKAPAAPDPVATAKAQTATNKETAYWNAVLNNVNQITPYGSLTYEQTGGGKKYNMDAYNQALQAWSAIPATAGNAPYTGDPHNMEARRQWEAQQKALQKGTPPKLEDFLIGDTPPQFTSTIKLTPEQQAIYDSQTRAQTQLSSLAEDQIGRINQALSSPYSFAGLPEAFTSEDAQTASRRGEEALLARLNPQFQRDEEALRTRLINQGIAQGSQAYNTEMERFGQTVNDARTQAILQGANYGGTLQNQSLDRRNQAINEYNTQRSAPLNEYIGLSSGVQVQNPQFTNQGYQGMQPVDYANLVNQQYQANLGKYNADVASGNATQSALFGLGGQALGGFLGSSAGSSWLAGLLSDERLKENIEHEGYTPGGIGVYSYNFIGTDERDYGVLAQEVELTHPELVKEGPDGFKRVIYSGVR